MRAVRAAAGRSGDPRYGRRVDQLAPAIECRVREWAERRPHVRVVGVVPHTAMPDLLRSVDLLAMPSEFEAFGISAAEALACGVPVVAFAAGGLEEVVVDGETGVLVREQTAEALASALTRLLRSPERLVAMGAAGRKDAVGRFSWRTHMVSLWELYQRVNPAIGPNPF